MTTTVKRKYALTKVAAGDYLLPSNDAQTIWRIAQYVDGPSYGIVEGMDRDRQFWGVWRSIDRITGDATIDPSDWSRWEMYDQGYDRRSDAIDAALRLG